MQAASHHTYGVTYDVTPPFPESPREFSALLHRGLDTPGGDFITLDSSVMVEEKLARSCWE